MRGSGRFSLESGAWRDSDTECEVGAASAEPLAAAYSSALASSLLRDWPRADASLAMARSLLQTSGAPGRNAAAPAAHCRDRRQQQGERKDSPFNCDSHAHGV